MKMVIDEIKEYVDNLMKKMDNQENTAIAQQYKELAETILSCINKRIDEKKRSFDARENLRYVNLLLDTTVFYRYAAEYYRKATICKSFSPTKAAVITDKKNLAYNMDPLYASIEATLVKLLGLKETVAMHLDASHQMHRNQLEKIKRRAQASLIAYQKLRAHAIAKIPLKASYLEKEHKIFEYTHKHQLSVELIYKHISKSISEWINAILQECLVILGKPPCDYALTGWGALARCETTPYDNYDLGILISERNTNHATKAYFQRLLIFINFKIILCKVNPHGALEKGLNQPGLTVYYPARWKQPRFDLSPLSLEEYKISLENYADKKSSDEKRYELIGTPSEMAKLYMAHLGKNSIPLARILDTLVFIGGNNNLVEKYSSLVAKNFQQQKAESISHSEKERLFKGLQVKNILNQYVIAPTSSRRPYSQNGYFLLNPRIVFSLVRLSCYFGKLPHTRRSVWDNIRMLSELNILHPEGSKNVCLCLSHLYFIQLNMCLKYGTLGGANNHYTDILSEKIGINGADLRGLYKTLIPWNKALQRLFATRQVTFLMENRFYDNSKLTQALIYEKLFNHRRAISLYSEVLDAYAENQFTERFRIYNKLGNLYYLINDFNNADKFIHLAIELALKNLNSASLSKPLRLLSELYLKHGKHIEMIRELKTLMATFYNNISDKEKVSILLIIAKMYQEMGYYALSVNQTEKAEFFLSQEKNKLYAELRMIKAQGLIELGRVDEAEQLLSSLLTEQEKNSNVTISFIFPVYLALAKICQLTKKTKDAIFYLSKIIDAEVGFEEKVPLYRTKALISLGEVYLEKNHFYLAIDCFNNALYLSYERTREPNYQIATLFNEIGNSYERIGVLCKDAILLNLAENSYSQGAKLLANSNTLVQAYLLHNLANLYDYMSYKRSEEKINLYKQALSIKKLFFTKYHPFMVNTFQALIWEYHSLNDKRASLKYADELADLVENTLLNELEYNDLFNSIYFLATFYKVNQVYEKYFICMERLLNWDEGENVINYNRKLLNEYLFISSNFCKPKTCPSEQEGHVGSDELINTHQQNEKIYSPSATLKKEHLTSGALLKEDSPALSGDACSDVLTQYGSFHYKGTLKASDYIHPVKTNLKIFETLMF